MSKPKTGIVLIALCLSLNGQAGKPGKLIIARPAQPCGQGKLCIPGECIAVKEDGKWRLCQGGSWEEALDTAIQSSNMANERCYARLYEMEQRVREMERHGFVLSVGGRPR